MELCPSSLGLSATQLEDGASPKLSWFLSDPERCRKPCSEVERPLPAPRVMASDDEWNKIGALLVELGVCEVVPDSDVPWFEGEEISHGCFGVIKPSKHLPDGRAVLRLIMGVRRTNSLFHTIEGDLRAVAGAPSFLRAVVLPSKVFLICAEDLVASFYLVRLPKAWHRWFVFERSVLRSALGLPGGGRARIASVVLPMGFNSATGFMQSWYRHVALRNSAPGLDARCGLDGSSEVRGGRPFPLSASAG